MLGIITFFCTFDFVEGTFARKYSNKFGVLLTYSYLCRRITKIVTRKWTTTRRIITIRKAGDQGGKAANPFAKKLLLYLKKD
jgi:hypothetical protein